VYPLARGGQPRKLFEVPPQPERTDLAHVAAFFDAVRGKRKPPADIDIAATAALTAILGREAIYAGKVINWTDLIGQSAELKTL
jgi:hypothetical protein